MKIMKSLKKVTALALAAVTAFTYSPISAKAADDTAFTIRLEKYQGSVSVTNASRRKQTLRKDMRLLNGYRVDTQLSSYAWVSLDSTKAAKLDQKSSVELRKSGRKLQLMVKSGKMFFNVTKKLDDDESMEIKSSTMVTGIRGTFGWTDEVQPGHTTVNILNGRVECVLENPTGGGTKKQIINSGESAEFISTGTGDNAQTKVIKTDIQKEDIPGSMMVEIVQDPNMVQTISDGTGGNLDLSNVTLEEANAKMEQEQQEMAALNQQVQNQVQKQEEETVGGGESEFVITVPATGSGTGTTNPPTTVDPGTGGGGGGYSGGGGGTSGGGGGNSGGGGGSSDGGGGGGGDSSGDTTPRPVPKNATIILESISSLGTFEVVGSYPTATASDGQPMTGGYTVQGGKTFKCALTVNESSLTDVEGIAPVVTAVFESGDPQECSFVPSSSNPSSSTTNSGAMVYTYTYVVPEDVEERTLIFIAWRDAAWKYYGSGSSSSSGSTATLSFTKPSGVGTGAFTVSEVKYWYGDDGIEAGTTSSGSFTIPVPEGTSQSSPEPVRVTFFLSIGDGYHMVSNSSQQDIMPFYSSPIYSGVDDEAYHCECSVSGNTTIEIPVTQAFYGVLSTYAEEGGSQDLKALNIYSSYSGKSVYCRYSKDGVVYAPNSPNKNTISKVVIQNNIKPTDTTGWFDGMESLTAVEGLANLDTSSVTSMVSMFNGCNHLTSIPFTSAFKTTNVTNMSLMFNGCSALTSLDLSSFNTSNVTNMASMFNGCATLATLNLGSNFSTANVTDMSNMFGSCDDLASVDVSGFNTAKVTDMTQMFDGCSALTSLALTGFNTARVTSMKMMFQGCSGLSTLNLSSFATSSVEAMTSMFSGCINIESIIASDSFVTSGITNSELGLGMFSNCSKLNANGYQPGSGYGPVRWSAENVDHTMAFISKPGTSGTEFGYFRPAS